MHVHHEFFEYEIRFLEFTEQTMIKLITVKDNDYRCGHDDIEQSIYNYLDALEYEDRMSLF